MHMKTAIKEILDKANNTKGRRLHQHSEHICAPTYPNSLMHSRLLSHISSDTHHPRQSAKKCTRTKRFFRIYYVRHRRASSLQVFMHTYRHAHCVPYDLKNSVWYIRSFCRLYLDTFGCGALVF